MLAKVEAFAVGGLAVLHALHVAEFPVLVVVVLADVIKKVGLVRRPAEPLRSFGNGEEAFQSAAGDGIGVEMAAAGLFAHEREGVLARQPGNVGGVVAGKGVKNFFGRQIEQACFRRGFAFHGFRHAEQNIGAGRGEARARHPGAVEHVEDVLAPFWGEGEAHGDFPERLVGDELRGKQGVGAVFRGKAFHYHGVFSRFPPHGQCHLLFNRAVRLAVGQFLLAVNTDFRRLVEGEDKVAAHPFRRLGVGGAVHDGRRPVGLDGHRTLAVRGNFAPNKAGRFRAADFRPERLHGVGRHPQQFRVVKRLPVHVAGVPEHGPLHGNRRELHPFFYGLSLCLKRGDEQSHQ